MRYLLDLLVEILDYFTTQPLKFVIQFLFDHVINFGNFCSMSQISRYKCFMFNL